MPVNPLASDLSKSVRRRLSMFAAFAALVAVAWPSAFSVLDSTGSPVFSAAIGPSQGSWGTLTHVYALDFDSVSTTGTYTISVSGAIFASSVSFRIDTGANLYATPLANTLFFYENERDGANFIATPLRTAAGHLNDEHAKVYFTPTFNMQSFSTVEPAIDLTATSFLAFSWVIAGAPSGTP